VSLPKAGVHEFNADYARFWKRFIWRCVEYGRGGCVVAHESYQSKPQWIAVGMVGHLDDANTEPDADAVNRIVLPHDFSELLMPLVESGSTMMMTDAPILEHTTGKEMAVISSNPDA